jgi:hypothetical protein
MVKHHVLIGLGFKKQNFRNRGLQYMLNHRNRGSALPSNQMTIMPVTRPAPTIGGVIGRRPLKFNY